MPEPASSSSFDELHQAIRAIAENLSTVRVLANHETSTSVGHVCLMQAIQDVESGAPATTDERWNSWRRVVTDLRRNVDKASKLWGQPDPDSASTIGQHFTAAGTDSAACGDITRASSHELVLVLGRLMLNPRHVGTINENDMGKAGARRDVAPDVIRKRTLEALTDRRWWDTTRVRLQQEFNRVVIQRGGNHEQTAIRPGAVQTAHWHDLDEKEQAAVTWILTQQKGATLSRSQILGSAKGLHDKGDHRQVLRRLAERGILIATKDIRPQLRMLEIPADTPTSLQRHSSWQEPG